MKAVVVLCAAFAFASVAARGQGQFLFNTHNPSGGNDVSFEAFCFGQIAPDAVVQVLAGPDFTSASLIPLTPTLTLSLPASGPTYPNPSAQLYTVPGMPAGAMANVVLRLIAGNQVCGTRALNPVLLTEPPQTANEVSLGNRTLYVYYCPEPSSWTLVLVGIGLIIIRPRWQTGSRLSCPQHS